MVKWIGWLLVAIGLGGLSVSIWGASQYGQFLKTPLTIPETGLHLDVEKGSTYADLVRDLKQRSITSHDWQWRLLGRFDQNAGRLKAGEYYLQQPLTAPQLLSMIAAGDVVHYPVTLIEGLRMAEALAMIRATPHVETTPLELDQLPELLGADAAHPEGLALPETYYFPRGATDISVLKRAHDALNRQLTELWEQRDPNLPYASAYEALIMASIIEKETAVDSERETIAGVFVRRLNRRMRLQTDPTVIYGLGDTFDGDIRTRDLRTDTPYNTYTRHGLPPTPIALASAASIEAAFFPEPGEALYFVAKGDGSHHFSATLAEHERAVDKYIRGR